MNIEEIYYKWCDEEELTEEEFDGVGAFIVTKLEQGWNLSAADFDFILERWNYDEAEFVEELGHGWNLYNYVITAPNGKHYMFRAIHHDDRGFDNLGNQTCIEVEEREVVVKKWVEVQNG